MHRRIPYLKEIEFVGRYMDWCSCIGCKCTVTVYERETFDEVFVLKIEFKKNNNNRDKNLSNIIGDLKSNNVRIP